MLRKSLNSQNPFDMRLFFLFAIAASILTSCSSGDAYDCEIQVSFADELKRISDPASKEFKLVLDEALKKCNPEKDIFIEVFFEVAKEKYPDVEWNTFFLDVYDISDYTSDDRVKGTLLAHRKNVIDQIEKDLIRNYEAFGIRDIKILKTNDLISFSLEVVESEEKIRKIIQSNTKFAIYETVNIADIEGLDRKINHLLYGDPDDTPLDSAQADSTSEFSLEDIEAEATTLDETPTVLLDRLNSPSCYFQVPTKDAAFLIKALNSDKGPYNRFGTILYVPFSEKAGKQSNPGYTTIYACRKPSNEKQKITNQDIEYASGGFNEGNHGYSVNLTFTEEGRGKWREFTATNVGNVLAMVLNDDIVLSAPMVMSQISGGMTEISGGMTKAESEELAEKILSQYWTVPCKIIKAEKRK